ncbi:MAG: glucose-1-phosphate adenylyltransferase [Candidatus Omnitrophica bacterium]|nr:glucose-1-phosphate adenylyltransferase [Candidatus Omnitrophota bacterium]
MRDVLTFILAGGKGERLNPLTRDRAKPAVPFGGIYRIIDFTLSNCVNSGLRRIFLLTQYKSFSLQRHLLEGWNIYSNQLGEFIDIIPAQQRIGADWYKGTADALYQNIYAIQDYDPKLILILAGDHIYKMDYRKLIEYHMERGADMTVGCIRMPKEESINFGVIEVDGKNQVTGFQEKPTQPKTVPGTPDQIYGSMGIYLFNAAVLLNELELDAKHSDSGHDFGKNIIPQMIAKRSKVLAYQFNDEENVSTYWRDIGTRDAYYQANMDLLGQNPKFNLNQKSWPLRTYHHQYPPIKVITAQDEGQAANPSLIEDAIIASGCVIEGARVVRSVLSSNVHVKKRAEVVNSVIMEGVVIAEGAKIQNAIVDKDNYIPPNTMIGFDIEEERKKFAVTASGIVIVAKRTPL